MMKVTRKQSGSYRAVTDMGTEFDIIRSDGERYPANRETGSTWRVHLLNHPDGSVVDWRWGSYCNRNDTFKRAKQQVAEIEQHENERGSRLQDVL